MRLFLALAILSLCLAGCKSQPQADGTEYPQPERWWK
jgi:hypothetical protein